MWLARLIDVTGVIDVIDLIGLIDLIDCRDWFAVTEVHIGLINCGDFPVEIVAPRVETAVGIDRYCVEVETDADREIPACPDVWEAHRENLLHDQEACHDLSSISRKSITSHQSLQLSNHNMQSINQPHRNQTKSHQIHQSHSHLNHISHTKSITAIN